MDNSHRAYVLGAAKRQSTAFTQCFLISIRKHCFNAFGYLSEDVKVNIILKSH